IIRPAPDSPYGVEFLFLQDGKFIPVPLVMKNNQITASVKKGDLVAVKLYNSSGYEAAADVLVDGLSRFITASSEENRNCLDLIENDKPRLITGWYKDNQSVDSFRVGSYSRSVGFQFDADPGSAGTFTIAFRSAWKEGAQPPPNEPPKTRGPGIERGPERLDPTVNVKRETGRVRAIVKIYYDE
ncbi:MAG: hypothetical protein KDA78_16750, partial [Planctomycetaceae bacterium]|nr:hypothetical protein [Planctomycetaceae bacterium]